MYINPSKCYKICLLFGLFFFSLLNSVDAQNKSLLQIPAWFEPNTGQCSDDVKFVSRSANYLLLLKNDSAELIFSDKTTLKMQLIDANRKPVATGVDKLKTKVHYLCGNNPENWRKNVPAYSRIRYENVYPGISLIYYMTNRRLEYDFIVAPNVNPSSISLRFTGYHRKEIDANGNLILYTDDGKMYLHKPVCYQIINGTRKYVEGRYVVQSEGKIGFAIESYDTGKTLIIDPVLSYCTYFGGRGNDTGSDIAVDDDGNIYVTGYLSSAGFDTEGAYSGYHSSEDAFVLKLNPAGTEIIYCTYIGGSGSDVSAGIIVTGENKVCIAGQTSSEDFPEYNSVQTQPDDGDTLDGFVAMLSEDGSELVFSTYFGGTFVDAITGIAVDADGDLYIVGSTNSSDFPTHRAYREYTDGCGYEVFVAKLGFDSEGTANVIYSTYLGGSRDDRGFGIAVDAMKDVYVTGWTVSNDFPTTESAYQPEPGLVLTNDNGCAIDHDKDAFVTKFHYDEAGNTLSLSYSTYLGGAAEDRGNAIALDLSGNASVVGFTSSPGFPIYYEADDTMGLGGDAFVAKLNVDGSRLIFSTFWGGDGIDEALGVAVDIWTGDTYVVGQTFSTDLPVQNAIQETNADSVHSAAFIAKFNETGFLQYSTYLADPGTVRGYDSAIGAVVEPNTGDLLITGATGSENFPVTEDAIQSTHDGGEDDAYNTDIFIAKISPTSSEDSGSGEDSGSNDNSGSSSGINCVATSITAGTPLAKGLPLLRRFRDEYLKPYSAGRLVIRTYYQYSPILASYINSVPSVKVMSKITIAGIMTHLKYHFTKYDISGKR